MTEDQIGPPRWDTGRTSWTRVRKTGAAALVVQALLSLIVWLLVDDKPSETWATRDFRQWALVSLVSAGVLAVLAGAVSRRWWVAGTVAAGAVLALGLGIAVFLGYAVLHSA